MSRPLDLFDLPTITRYTGEALPLDSARWLTRGSPLELVNFLAHLNPIKFIYTAVQNGDDGKPLLGGIIKNGDETFAHLNYLAPVERLSDNGPVTALVEHLAAQAGKWGTFHVVAEVAEGADAYRSLRMAGFAVYAWQRLWDLSSLPAGPGGSGWTRMRSADLIPVQNLSHQIIPALIQPIERTAKKAEGLVCYSGGIQAHVQVVAGPRGIFVRPLFHPEAKNVGAALTSLLGHLPSRNGRPVYLCVRSYQAWLEPVLEDLGATASERQAVMVKHLTQTVKEEQAVKAVQAAGVSVQPSRVSRMESEK
jgi:hypothetical protein